MTVSAAPETRLLELLAARTLRPETLVESLLSEQQELYDSKSGSDHGCDASGQATWEKDIADGLPNVTITVP